MTIAGLSSGLSVFIVTEVGIAITKFFDGVWGLLSNQHNYRHCFVVWLSYYLLLFSLNKFHRPIFSLTLLFIDY